MKLGLFNIETTYHNDYVRHKIKTTEPTHHARYDPLEHIPPPKKPIQMDLETLSNFSKDVYVPFDLFFRKKAGVNVNPHEKITVVKLEDKIFEEKLKVRKTRPRVYMIPQICLDNVPEDVMYAENGLAANIYTSEWKQYSKIVQSVNECKNPLKKSADESADLDVLTTQKAMDNVRFKPANFNVPIDEGMLKYVRDWDKFQPRAITDENKIFWNANMDKGLCLICEGLDPGINLSQAEKNEIKKALKDDLVRSPYSLLSPGYCGYKPMLPVGIPVRKTLFKKFEPFISSLMEVQGMYIKPKIK